MTSGKPGLSVQMTAHQILCDGKAFYMQARVLIQMATSSGLAVMVQPLHNWHVTGPEF